MINSGCLLLLWILAELSTMLYLSDERDAVLSHSDPAVPACQLLPASSYVSL